MPRAAIALRHENGVDQDGHDQAFGIVNALQPAQLGQRLAPRRDRIVHRFATPDTPRHSSSPILLTKNTPMRAERKFRLARGQRALPQPPLSLGAETGGKSREGGMMASARA